MKYKIIDIEGIGEIYAQKLMNVGIDTVDDLLKRCAKAYDREKLSAETGIPIKLILKWTNHADLFRIDGIGPQFAELLEASGVDTVKELRHRKAENLAAKITEVNETKKLTRRVPTAEQLQKMIEEAATLEPVIIY